MSDTLTDHAEVRSVRRLAMSLIIVVAAAMSFAQVLQSQPLQSANDRSRWATVWSLVERGTYQIDEIDAAPGWGTIDKVRHDGHFYSSKPPLQSTVVAGVYWCVKKVTGWNLSQQTAEVARVILLIVSWLPSVVSLIVLARLLERYAANNFGRLFVLVVASWGTLLSPFVSSLNNHSPAAACLLLAMYSTLRILIDGQRCWCYFALSGLFSAMTFSLELPAALVVAVAGVLLLRADVRRTLAAFLPAALIPIGAAMVTNFIAAGTLMPFYSGYGSDTYRYVHEGIPSYWMNPQGLDRNLDSPLMYFVHCTIGHHGLLSLTPVWLLTLVGWCGMKRWRSHQLSGAVVLGAVMTLIVFGFYLTRTQNYNYGGNSVALRWMLWLTPLWLIGMIPLFDKWGSCRWCQAGASVLLAASVVSASLPGSNPWQSPWLFTLLERCGWIEYDAPPPPFEKPLWSWFPKLGVPKSDTEFVRFVGTGTAVLGTEEPGIGVGEFDLTVRSMTPLATNRNESIQPIQFEWSHRNSAAHKNSATVFVDVASFNTGRKSSEFLRSDSGGKLSREVLIATQRLVTGLPVAVEFRPGHIRYLKTPLRPDRAFRCQRAAAQTMFQPQHFDHRLRYRCDVWLCDEIPFGVAQVDLTVTDPINGQMLSFQRLTAAEASARQPAFP